MTTDSIYSTPKSRDLAAKTQARMARWAETDSFTMDQFDLWLDRRYVELSEQLEERGLDREMYKQHQADLVAVAGARVAVRLFRDEMLQ